MSTLAPPHYVMPGACSCSTETRTRTCVCAPGELAETLDAFSTARLRADDARDRGDTIAERQHRDEQRRLGAEIREALTPQPMPESSSAPTTTPTRDIERDARDQMIERLRGAWMTNEV